MDEKQKRNLTILFILINVVIWPIFIFPNLGDLVKSWMSKNSQSQSEIIIKESPTQEKMRNPIDFHSLRDPFLIPNGVRPRTTTVKKTVKKTAVTKNTSKPTYNVTPAQKPYVSRFKLKSIVKVNNVYYANLEEAQHYGGNSSSGGVPYSYRFGPDGQPVSSSSSKSFMVVRGDSVLGEAVIKIREDYVIMAKNRKYYKLTFSGGFAVSKP